MNMNQQDIKNLVGWLQAIYKEAQETKEALHEMRRNISLLPEIKDSTRRGTQDSEDAERKIDETRNHLESRLNKLEDMIQDLRSEVKEVRSKVDRIKN